MYFITDQENKNWQQLEWGENIVHEETNKNFYFPVYMTPLVALHMYPFYDGIQGKPKVWEATGEGETITDGFRQKYSKLTTVREVDVAEPTDEQRVSFAILCSLNVVLNPVYRTWALNYLNGFNQKTETAAGILSQLEDQRCDDGVLKEHRYLDCVDAVLNGVILENPEKTVAGVYRAYHDSSDLGVDLDLGSMAEIVSILPAIEIAKGL